MPKNFALPIAFVVLLLCFVRPAGAITLGQVDDFQSADPLDRSNWVNGASMVQRINGGGPLGAGDNYIQVTANGGGQGGRLVAQNYNNPFDVPPIISQWTGDYIAAGVTAIELDLINQGSSTLSIRIAFKTDISQGAPGYLSNKVTLTAGSGWQHFSIPITAANLTAIGGPAAYNTFFQNGFEELRIINEAGATNLNGDPVVGTLGIDNVTAAPVPPVPVGFSQAQVGTNIGGSPTAMAIAPDGRIFVCQQGGQLRVIKNDVLLATPFVSLPVDSSGERGLLGVAFDPAFATNQYVYVYYTTNSAPMHNRISRFTANGDVALVGSEFVLMDLDNLSGATNHNGGAIHFGPDGKLYVGVGENANPANAQSITNRLGKILRINSDGTIPVDNPASFPGISGSTSGLNRAIWAVGLRNPFTFDFQPGTGRLFLNDVGQSAWEEINDGIAGSNYGWSICEGVCSPPNSDYRDPLFQYAHSGNTGSSGCAIVGAAFYNPPNNQFPNSYVGNYFFADLCNGWIRLFNSATNSASAFAHGISTPVDLAVGADGSLYYLAQGNGGQLFRVQFASTVAIQSAVSRKTHGSVGAFDVPLPLTGTPGVEPRTGGASNDYQIVVTLTGNGPISVDGSPQAQVASGTASIGAGGVSNGGAVTVSGSTITIPLTNVANAQTIAVTLNNVNDGTSTRSFTIPMSVLSGDTNASGGVSSSDISQVRAATGQTLGSGNFRADVNVSGTISASDVSLVKFSTGSQLPAAVSRQR